MRSAVFTVMVVGQRRLLALDLPPPNAPWEGQQKRLTGVAFRVDPGVVRGIAKRADSASFSVPWDSKWTARPERRNGPANSQLG